MFFECKKRLNILLQNQHLEISKLLEIKENEIASKCNEMDIIRQENNDLKEKLKVKINTILILFRALYFFNICICCI